MNPAITLANNLSALLDASAKLDKARTARRPNAAKIAALEAKVETLAAFVQADRVLTAIATYS